MQTEYWMLLGFSILAGLGLVLVGLKFLSESFQVLTGKVIRWVLNSINKSPTVSLFAGVFISFFVQSGITSATMALSYTSSGLFNLTQLMAFLLGTNVGTTITVWIFTVPVGIAELVLLGVGIFPMWLSKNSFLSSLGRLLFSLGLLLLGFHLMTVGMEDPFTFQKVLIGVFPEGSSTWGAMLVAFLVFAALASVLRSSVALVAVLMALVGVGALPATYGAVGVLGVNLGSTMPSLLFSLSGGTLARRGALAHFLTNAIAVFIVLAFFEPLVGLVSGWVEVFSGFGWTAVVESPGLFFIPLFHMILNLLIAILFAVLLMPLEKLVSALVKEREQKEPQKLKLFGSVNLLAPSLAIEQAFHEVKKLAATVESMLYLTNQLVAGAEDQQKNTHKVLKYERITDQVQSELVEFLAHVSELRLTEKQGLQLKWLMRLCDELESVADNCKGIYQTYKDNLQTAEGTQPVFGELRQFFNQVLSEYEHVFSALTEGEEGRGFSASSEEVISKKVQQIKLNYVEALQKTDGIDKAAAVSMGDILVYLIQIWYHTLGIQQSYKKYSS